MIPNVDYARRIKIFHRYAVGDEVSLNARRVRVHLDWFHEWARTDSAESYFGVHDALAGSVEEVGRWLK